MYEDKFGRKTNATGAIGISQAGVIIVTSAYVNAITKSNTREYKELQTIKEFKLRTILLYFDNLSEEERKIADEKFKDVNVIKKYADVPRSPEGFGKWLKEHSNEIAETAKPE